MSEQLVTIATCYVAYEAELARNLLQSEGIAGFVNGEVMACLLTTPEIRLQVSLENAPRAAAILAAAEASLARDWEDQAEAGAGFWTCSLCGELVPEEVTECCGCRTPRDATRPTYPPSLLRQEGPPPPDGVQARDQVTLTAAPTSAVPPRRSAEGEQDESPEDPESSREDGDDLAGWAYGVSLNAFTILCVAFLFNGPVAVFLTATASLCLSALSWRSLFRFLFASEERKAAGMSSGYLALLVNGLVVLGWAFISYCILSRN